MHSKHRLFLLFVLLAGCTQSGSWRNPALPPEQERADESDCRRSAEGDMGPQTYSSPGTERSDSPMQMVDRSDQRHHFGALVGECMERKGYRRSD